MNIKNLEVGQKIKNYKHLCEILEIAPSKGNGREYQIKRLENYVKFHKEGHKFIIDEIYDNPKRCRTGNSKYSEEFSILMINMLYNNIDNKTMLVSKGALYQAMNLINDNYRRCKQNIGWLSYLTDVPKEHISHFYGEENRRIRELTERNLDKLKDESIIKYNEVTVVAFDKVEIQYNKLGTPKLDKNGNVIFTKETIHRVATGREKSFLLECEQIAKECLGVESDKEIFATGRWEEYTNKINDIIKNSDVNIDYYYTAYEISWTKRKIEQLYKKVVLGEDISIVRKTINETISNSIRKSAEDKYNKSKDVEITELMSVTKTRRLKLRKDENYVLYTHKLTDVLIDKGGEWKLKSMEIEKRQQEKEELGLTNN